MDFLISQLHSSSLDIIILIIALAIDLFLSIIVFLSNTRSATNRTFSLLTICIVFWLIATYTPRIPELYKYSLDSHRFGIFFAAPMSALFFLLAHTIPSGRLLLGIKSYTTFVVATTGMMLLNLSPYAFTGVIVVGGASEPQTGWGFIPFAVLSTLFSILTVYELTHKYRNSSGDAKKQIKLVLSGILIMLFLIITTILIPIVFFDSLQFLPFAPLYTLVFLGMTAYAITKYQLFRIKVLVTQVLTLMLCLVLFAKLFGETTAGGRVVDGLVLLVVSVFGFFLVRSVRQEVEAREKIASLAKDLEWTNKQLETSNERLRILDQRKSEFVSIASHQLRTPVTAMKGYASLLLEDTYGALPEKMKDPVGKIFHSADRLALMINDFLNVSKIEQGSMTYTFTPIDLKKIVVDLVEDFHVVAGEKKLDLATDIPDNVNFYSVADAGKLRQIISNLIDNAIKYTPEGSVRLILSKEPHKGEFGMVLLQIRDSGIGLSQDDIHHLFGKFTRGAEGSKINTTGSGLGLYIAKKMMEEHKGDIWVDSEGKGKGSVFCIELPEFKGELPKE